MKIVSMILLLTSFKCSNETPKPIASPVPHCTGNSCEVPVRVEHLKKSVNPNGSIDYKIEPYKKESK